MKSYVILKTDLVGELLLTAEGGRLTGVHFNDCGDSTLALRGGRLDSENPVLQQAAEELREYLAGVRTAFTVPLYYSGTGLQEAVWREIALIRYGETISYSELARRAHAAETVRAVGTTTGQNPIAIIIPCHRVMGKDGKLRGYGGGLERKRRLLALENKGAGLELIPDGPVRPLAGYSKR